MSEFSFTRSALGTLCTNMRLEYVHASNPYLAVESSATNSIARREKKTQLASRVVPEEFGRRIEVLTCPLDASVEIAQAPIGDLPILFTALSFSISRRNLIDPAPAHIDNSCLEKEVLCWRLLRRCSSCSGCWVFSHFMSRQGLSTFC